jgi:hypothetical protein
MLFQPLLGFILAEDLGEGIFINNLTAVSPLLK